MASIRRDRHAVFALTAVIAVVVVVVAFLVPALGRLAVSPSPAGSPAAYAEKVTSRELGSTLDELAKIASENGGTRRTGGPGDAATVAYLEAALRMLGYQPVEDAFQSPVYTDGTGDSLAISGAAAPTVQDGRDYGALMFSPAGTASGPVVALDWDPNATAADGLGCKQADFAKVPAGAIVLTRPAACLRRNVLINAQAAGAVGLVTGYPWLGPGEIRRPTLVDPAGLQIPAIAVDREAADALATAATTGAQVRIATTGSTTSGVLRSVIAELPGVDRSRVVIIGAHLDSSMDGPGIDDDGSGVAAVLALAQAMAGSTPPVTLRFAFWAAEESGLHGSTHYVDGLAGSGGPRVVAYLNADMLGSPNGYRAIYDDANAAPGSSQIRDLFEADLTAAGLSWKTIDLFGASDHAPFEQAGIPTGGLFSGANEVITAADAAQFGRQVGEYADDCYHLACDGRSNVDAKLLLELVQSLARVTLEVAAAPPG
ncbi:MAG TPA: M20/M25/M40 family metallo-hydrolase [Candidatus Limnocylindrales bacterium]|nr:M20/M25/M40 family metallo-hydrolase [Candidatus Limnocylindrales bacterium]